MSGPATQAVEADGGRSSHCDRLELLAAEGPALGPRQQSGLGSVIAALFGLVTASAGAAALGGLLLLAAVGLGLYARHTLALAGRSRVGARFEDDVQRALAPLRAEGWRLRHSLPWQGRGDIDSVAISPTGIAVAIETKTGTYDGGHLAQVREQAAWLSRRRRRWARTGALGVMCPSVRGASSVSSTTFWRSRSTA